MVYYKVMSKTSDVEQIQYFSKFGLLDQEFLQIQKGLGNPMPYPRGIV